MRAIQTANFNLKNKISDYFDKPMYDIGNAFTHLTKSAGVPSVTHKLSGRLYISKSGWLLLSVPNSLVRGAFDALAEPGIELPLNDEGRLNGHISVMHKDEVDKIGAENITEVGHQFHYNLGPLKEVMPETWDGISKCWYLTVYSSELQNLRKSYGLSPKPHDNEFDFHLTIARRKKNVLRHNDVSKAAADEDKKEKKRPKCVMMIHQFSMRIMTDDKNKDHDPIHTDVKKLMDNLIDKFNEKNK